VSSQVEQKAGPKDITPQSAWDRIAELEAYVRSLLREIQIWKNQVEGPEDRYRLVYPPGPWKCRCGEVTERPRRSMCPACYYRWYRRQKLMVA
jgi:hypothetical protein